LNYSPTGAAYLTARIARYRPDVLERMRTGEFETVAEAARPPAGPWCVTVITLAMPDRAGPRCPTMILIVMPDKAALGQAAEPPWPGRPWLAHRPPARPSRRLRFYA
jgi:hypothetical protein